MEFDPFLRTRNMHGPHFGLTTRDNAILDYLWKWKLATTANLHDWVGGFRAQRTTYRAMLRLRKHGYVEIVRLELPERISAWQLTDYGFNSIRESLGELKEHRILSGQKWHDLNILAFQLGEWPRRLVSNVTHFTEQELNCRSQEDYPEWVPKNFPRRADGYTHITTPEKNWTLAFEVELHAKSAAHYESIIRYYRMYRKLDRVYWLVGDNSIREKIVSVMTNVRDEVDNYHVFVDLNEYRHRGWDSDVLNSRTEKLFTMRENMRAMAGEYAGL